MSFYLIYIDEFGDSGTRLDDPQQPIFQLQAALVPVEDGNWIEVEQVCTELIREISTTLNTDENVRLHMVDLYQRKGIYRKASIAQTFSWIERILQVALDCSISYASKEINKLDYLEFSREQGKLDNLITKKDNIHLRLPVYDLLFPAFLIEIDQQLSALDAYGMILVDQHKGQQFENYSNLDAYRIMRSQGILKRIIENPIFRDSRVQTLLALPDFSGYIAANSKIDKLHGKNRPRLSDWYSTFVQPRILQHSSQGMDKDDAYSLRYNTGFSTIMIHVNYLFRRSSFIEMYDIIEGLVDIKNNERDPKT